MSTTLFYKCGIGNNRPKSKAVQEEGDTETLVSEKEGMPTQSQSNHGKVSGAIAIFSIGLSLQLIGLMVVGWISFPCRSNAKEIRYI